MSKKILVAEDEEAIRIILETKLRDAGYDVATSNNGEECLAAMEEYKPDLVLLDIIMPKKDGITLLKEVTTSNRALNTQIIVLTNKSDYNTQHEAWNYGVKVYLVKAETSLEDVVNRVKDALTEAK